MYTSQNIPEGQYKGHPRKCGVVKTDNGYLQFAIECAIIVPLNDGNYEEVAMTKFGGIDSDEGFGYAIQDGENVGCDVTKPIEEWEVDTKLTVVCVVKKDDYGLKLKSIFKDTPLEAGFLINKMAIPQEDKAVILPDLNARRAAILKARNDAKPLEGKNGGGTPPQQNPDDAKRKVEKAKRQPL